MGGVCQSRRYIVQFPRSTLRPRDNISESSTEEFLSKDMPHSSGITYSYASTPVYFDTEHIRAERRTRRLDSQFPQSCRGESSVHVAPMTHELNNA